MALLKSCRDFIRQILSELWQFWQFWQNIPSMLSEFGHEMSERLTKVSCSVSSHAGKPLFIVTFNFIQDNIYWMTRDKRQVPDNGHPIRVDGIGGGGAVKVAVLYNTFVDDRARGFVCDIFTVPENSQLRVERVTQGAGVESYSGHGVELLVKGKVISLDNSAAKTAKLVLQVLEPVARACVISMRRAGEAPAVDDDDGIAAPARPKQE